MQDKQLQDRLASLKKEFEAGQIRLRELDEELTHVRETMLRISGAIQVLEELADKSNPDPEPLKPRRPQPGASDREDTGAG